MNRTLFRSFAFNLVVVRCVVYAIMFGVDLYCVLCIYTADFC